MIEIDNFKNKNYQSGDSDPEISDEQINGDFKSY
jgi:hypothetical protein